MFMLHGVEAGNCMHMHSYPPWYHVDVKVQWQTLDFSIHCVDRGQELKSPGLVLGAL